MKAFTCQATDGGRDVSPLSVRGDRSRHTLGFVRVYNSKTAANARRFLRDLERACPIRIRTILTDNGKEFTDRLFGPRKRAATGKHDFDTLCAALDIEHRLTPPRSPQTNGMVEWFNGRIEDVLQSHHFRSGEELDRYVWLVL